MEPPSEKLEAALAALEGTAKALETELAGWRRRCLKAEGELEEGARRVPAMTSGDVTLLRPNDDRHVLVHPGADGGRLAALRRVIVVHVCTVGGGRNGAETKRPEDE